MIIEQGILSNFWLSSHKFKASGSFARILSGNSGDKWKLSWVSEQATDEKRQRPSVKEESVTN